MTHQIAPDKFHFDGRGPELQRAIWDSCGTRLLAIEYRDSDGTRRHVRFRAPQVVIFTPEEVVRDPRQGGAIDLVIRLGYAASLNGTSLVAAIFSFYSTTIYSILSASLWSSLMEHSSRPPNHAMERTADRCTLHFLR